MKKGFVGGTILSIILSFIINYFMGYSVYLFCYDIVHLFKDNRRYLIHIFIPIVIFCYIISFITDWIHQNKMNFIFKIRLYKNEYDINVRKLLNLCGKKIYRIGKIVCVVIILYSIVAYMPYFRVATWKGSVTVAHAGGMYDNNYYLNSLEAIEYNYKLGQRTFEIDFCVTSDNKLICKHDWDYAMQEGNEPGEVWDEKTFLSVPLLGKYTPISFDNLCSIMNQYPDMWVVTDTKDVEKSLVQRDFRIMVDTAKRLNMENVLKRIIVQIYNEEMYDTVNEIYKFDAWIYTLYQFFGGDEETFRECVRFCYSKNIDGIATWNYMITPELISIAEQYGVKVYVHTEDDVQNAKKLKKQGVYGFYTNIITPEMLKED